MRVLSLKIDNILSIKEAQLTFEDSGLVLVDGWNHDDGRANGAGKTAIFNALSFALYGKLPRKITASEVLRKGSTKASVEVTVMTDDGIYTVIRGRPRSLLFKKDGQDVTMTQEEFEYKIKLSYDQFLVSMYTAQQSGSKFLDLNDTQKKDFLLQLMNLNEFAACRKEAEAEIKAIDQNIYEETVKIEKAKSKIDAYSESFDVDISRDTISHMQLEIDSLHKEIKKLELIQKPDLSKYIKLESDVQSKLEKLATIRYARNREYNDFISLSNMVHPFKSLSPDASCPHCDGELMIQDGAVSKPGDTAVHKMNHEAKMNEYKSQMRTKKELIDKYDTQLSQESKLRNLLEKSREKKDSESREYNSAINQISNFLSTIEKRQSTINITEQKIKQIEELKEKVDVLKKYIIKATSIVDTYNNDKELYKAVSSMCAPTGAPAYIMDSIVESFNEIVSDHVSLIWPNASYSLQSYKENKTGDTTAKFSELLIINGKERSIGSLSGGEHRALSLSIDFTIIDILSKQFGIPLNPIIMDEPFEGLDTTGREVIIELLNKLSLDRQIWIVDHASEVKSMFSQVIRIEKQNGISSIVT